MFSVEIGIIKCPCHKLVPKHSPECKEYEEVNTSQKLQTEHNSLQRVLNVKWGL